MLNRDTILAYKDYATKDIDIPEWGGQIRIRSLSLKERAELFDRQSDTNLVRVQSEALIVIAAVIDENGNQVFKAEDIDVIIGKSPAVIERLSTEILTLSGLAPAGDLEKNSGSGPAASV